MHWLSNTLLDSLVYQDIIVKDSSLIWPGWHNVPQEIHLSLILLAIVYPDGNRTIFSRALLDADFGLVGRNQHPARLRERTLS